MWGRAQPTCREWGGGHSLSLLLPTDNLTLTPELREAEVFILDNKKCDHIFHRTSFYPQVIPLIRRNMLCATNYGENACYVSFWGLLADLFLNEYWGVVSFPITITNLSSFLFDC